MICHVETNTFQRTTARAPSPPEVAFLNMKKLTILSFVATCIASSVCGYGQEPGFQVKPAVGKPTNPKAVEAMVVQKGVETDSLKPFPVLKRPIPSYLADENRHFQGCPSVTMSKGGRLWCTWLSGAATESQDNALVGASGGGSGKSGHRLD